MRRWIVGLALIATMTVPMSLMAQSSSRLVAFVALRDGSKMQTNGDVINYLIASKLSDSAKQDFYRQSKGDFNKYKEIERSWAQEHFDMGLRQMAYFELLKKHYLRDLKKGASRQYFNATENAWYERVEKEENRVLKELLDQRLGIVKAREQFGTWLQEQDYPHIQNESGTDTYFRWFDALKARLKVEMQMEEIQEYEVAMAVKKNRGGIKPSPTDIWDLNEKSQQLITEQLDGKNLSQEQLDELSGQYPEMLVMVKDIKRLSLANSKLSELEAVKETQNNITKARNALDASLKSKGNDGILKYLDLAQQMRDKYVEPNKLIELAHQSLDQFMQTGDFNSYVLGRLYKLAAVLDNSHQASDLKKVISTKLNAAINEASAFKISDTTLEEAVYQNALAVLPNDDDVVAEASSLIAWVIKFEAKKLALKDIPIMHVVRYDYKTSEAYDRLSNSIKVTRLQNGLKKFRDQDIKNMAWQLELSNGQRYIMNNNVYPYLIAN